MIIKKIKTKAKEAPKRGRGRPRKVIPVASVELEVERFASVGCTQEEIATLLGIGKATLERNYGPVYEKGLANLKQSLRRKQVDLANGGNVTMLIWLGKNLLGQKDRSEVTGKDGASLVPGSIIFTMPKNGRDQDKAKVEAPTRPPEKASAEQPPAEQAAVPLPPPPPPPPSPPVHSTARPAPTPRYRGGGRDSRVAEDIRNLRPIPDDMPGASTGKR